MIAQDALRKGWCPGALRPMMARDGLLVRLRITGGIVPAATARAIADLAERHGNGLLDLSARANLQLRGVREAALPALLDGLDALGLLDADPTAEAVRNVLASPLAGCRANPPPRSGGGGPREAWWRGQPQAPFGHRFESNPPAIDRRQPPPPPAAVPLPRCAEEDRPDIRPLVAALEAALMADVALRALPPKFGFLIDDGSAPSLAGIAADLRFDWDGAAFAVGLGGTAAEALDLGTVAADGLVARAIAIAHRLLAVPGTPRRARTLMRDLGRGAVAAWLEAGPSRSRPQGETPQVVGARTFHGIATFGVAVPFGRLDAAMLRAAADASAGELRLTPWRVILLPEVEAAALEGFILDPTDPRLLIAACTGKTGCERGTTDTHADALALAGLAATLPGSGIAVHVSGCAKGCAHPAKASLTLVGQEGRYDVVRCGRPGDAPDKLGLTMDEIEAVCHRTSQSASGSEMPYLPSPLWGGAGVGVGPCVSISELAATPPFAPSAKHGPTPTPSPSPLGEGEPTRERRE